jgi:hypothetical protein
MRFSRERARREDGEPEFMVKYSRYNDYCQKEKLQTADGPVSLRFS